MAAQNHAITKLVFVLIYKLEKYVFLIYWAVMRTLIQA